MLDDEVSVEIPGVGRLTRSRDDDLVVLRYYDTSAAQPDQGKDTSTGSVSAPVVTPMQERPYMPSSRRRESARKFPPRTEGVLTKLGGANPLWAESWKTRRFVLEEGVLRYYEVDGGGGASTSTSPTVVAVAGGAQGGEAGACCQGGGAEGLLPLPPPPPPAGGALGELRLDRGIHACSVKAVPPGGRARADRYESANTALPLVGGLVGLLQRSPGQAGVIRQPHAIELHVPANPPVLARLAQEVTNIHRQGLSAWAGGSLYAALNRLNAEKPRTWYFCATSQDEQQRWITAFQASIDAIRDSFHDETLLAIHRDLGCPPSLSPEQLRPFVDQLYERCYPLPTQNGFGLHDLITPVDDEEEDDEHHHQQQQPQEG